MKTKIMRDYNREKLIKFILRGSIALDIFIYICFFIGFAMGLGGAEIGFLMIGIVFRYGLIIAIISIVLKLIIVILNFTENTDTKVRSLAIALSSMFLLLIINGVIWGIYYIGKVMSAVG